MGDEAFRGCLPPLPRPPGGSHETDARSCRGGESIESTLAHACVHTLALVFQSATGWMLYYRGVQLTWSCDVVSHCHQIRRKHRRLTSPQKLRGQLFTCSLCLVSTLPAHGLSRGGPILLFPVVTRDHKFHRRSVQHSQRFSLSGIQLFTSSHTF